MDSRTATERAPSPEAIEFVRFCYRRRRVGWPELYDEMCAVAGRGLFRGWGSDELSTRGIGFSLFELPALAALVGRVVAEDHERRPRPTAAEVRLAHAAASAQAANAASAATTASTATTADPVVPADAATTADPPRPVAGEASADSPGATDLRFTGAPATAGA